MMGQITPSQHYFAAHRTLFVALSAVALFAAVSIYPWDGTVVDHVVADEPISVVDAAKLVGSVGSPWSLLVTSGILFLLARTWRPRQELASYALFVFLAAATTAMWATLLKFLVGRSRPVIYLYLHIQTLHPFDHSDSFASFPSAHAAVAAAVATALSLIFPKYWRIFVLIAVAVAASQVSLALHYPSDALAGLLLGFVITSALATLIEGVSAHRRT